jgi:NADPH:quinone reductase-like Zn-dependent oxidoreductase
MQFALAAGAEVWVTSSSPEKIERAKALGAAGGALYTEEGWSKTLAKRSGGFDVLVDSAAGPGFKDLLATANPGGRLGIYGGTRGKISGLSPQLVFWKELEIHGSKMGSDREFKAMVNFVERHRIHPIIDKNLPLSAGETAFKRMADGAQFGKIVLEIS